MPRSDFEPQIFEQKNIFLQYTVTLARLFVEALKTKRAKVLNDYEI